MIRLLAALLLLASCTEPFERQAQAARTTCRLPSQSGNTTVASFDFEAGVTGWAGAVQASDEHHAGTKSMTDNGGGTMTYTISSYEEFRPYRVTYWTRGQGALSFGAPAISDGSWGFHRNILRTPLLLATALGQSRDTVRFSNTNSLRVDDVVIERVGTAEAAALNDSAINHIDNPIPGPPLNHADVRAFTSTSRFRYLPRTRRILQWGGVLRVVGLGDSLMANTFNGQWDALVMRAFPCVRVQPLAATCNQCGVDDWNAADLQTNLYSLKPDLIYIGGVSSVYNDATDWNGLIAKIKANLPGTDIVLGSYTKGGDAGVSSAFLTTVAAANKVGFFDAATSIDNFFTDSGASIGTYLFDGVHLDEVGQEVPARAFAWFLGAGP